MGQIIIKLRGIQIVEIYYKHQSEKKNQTELYWHSWMLGRFTESLVDYRAKRQLNLLSNFRSYKNQGFSSKWGKELIY